MTRSGLCTGLWLLACSPAYLAGQPLVTEQQLEQLLLTINRVSQELEQTRTDRSDVFAEIQRSEQAIGVVQGQISAINARISAGQMELAELQFEAGQLEEARAQQQTQLTGYLVNAWQSGQQEYLKLLLNQQDPRMTARMLRYYAYFSAARAERIADFTRILQELDSLSLAIANTTAILAGERQALDSREAELERQQTGRRQMLDALDVVLAERGEQLDQLEFERIELELLLEELRQAVTDLGPDGADLPFADMRGSLTWPVTGPLINSFGERHELGDLNWEGITIKADNGTTVQAIHPGRVVFSDWFGNSGLLLIIDHGDGYMSLYAHNQALMKTVGDWVAAGETIATAGNTGGQKETALYFEIRRNGMAINPVDWLGRR